MRNRYVALFVILFLIVSLLSVYVIEMSYQYPTKVPTISTSDLSKLFVPPPGVIVGKGVIYINSNATIPVELGQMSMNVSMYSFSIFGEVNPKIVIKQGSAVKFMAINVDTDAYHNFVVTNQGPPYSSNFVGMMGGNSGGNYDYGGMMQGYYGFNNSYGYMMFYLPPQSTGHYYYAYVTYVFATLGTYWYVCTYPGHAASGMYGEIVVN